VVDGDDDGAELVRDPARVPRGPERVVEQHDLGTEHAQSGVEPRSAEGDAVSVRRRQPERALLVAVGVAAALAPGYHEVVLDRPGAGREVRLGLEVGPDAAAALAIEDGHVRHP
jgi:hypothetical protein